MTDDELAQAVQEALTPCRTWCYIEQVNEADGVSRTITDREILATYFPNWCDQMHRALKSDQISEEACIQDFVMIYWAWELK